MQIQDFIHLPNTVKLTFPVPDGCMECPLSRSDELGYPFECQWDRCPFNEPGEYYYDPESCQIKRVSIQGRSGSATTEDTFTTSEVAKMFGVSISTVRRWVQAKQLIARRKTIRNEYVIYYGDMAKFCLEHPKYIWHIPLRVSAKKIFVGEVI